MTRISSLVLWEVAENLARCAALKAPVDPPLNRKRARYEFSLNARGQFAVLEYHRELTLVEPAYWLEIGLTDCPATSLEEHVSQAAAVSASGHAA